MRHLLCNAAKPQFHEKSLAPSSVPAPAVSTVYLHLPLPAPASQPGNASLCRPSPCCCPAPHLAAAAGRGLDHDWEANVLGHRHRVVCVLDHARPARDGVDLAAGSEGRKCGLAI